MNELLQNKVVTIESREVAEMMEMEHSEILKKLEGTKRADGSVKQIGIIPTMNKGKIPAVNYFIKSSYKDAKGEIRPCYEFTKMGCEFIANKFTGEKGILFTAKYVKRFNEMERNETPIAQLSPQLQILINMELEQKKLKQEVAQTKTELKDMREVIIINPKETWRKETNRLITKVCKRVNDYKQPRQDIYKALEERAKCKLSIRLNNLIGRALKNGMTKSKAEGLNYLDVIANDQRLKEIYVAIVKEFAIKKGISL